MNLSQAALAIKSGKIIAYPTEGVWGLGCDPWNAEAIEQLLKIKNRGKSKGLIIVASSIDQIKPLCDSLPLSKLNLLRSTWPGPYNWIIPDTNLWLSDWVRGNHKTVAVRVSNHVIVKDLCNAVGHPVISTSANISGASPCKTPEEIISIFGDNIAGVVAGNLGGASKPCVIRNLITGEIIRSNYTPRS